MSDLQVFMTGSEWFGTVAGGLNRYFEDLYAALLADQNLDVSAAAFGVPVAPGTSWGKVEKTFAQRQISSRFPVRKERGLIVDRHFSLYGQSALKTFRGQHLVSHFQGPWAQESSIGGAGSLNVKLKFLIESSRLRRSDKIIVLSQRFKDILVHDYSIDGDTVHVISPGVDLTKFDSKSRPSATAPTVVCVRRLERRMGIHVLLKAWPSVVDHNPLAKLLIVGTGSEEQRLKNQAADAGISESVSFTGRVSDRRLIELYEQALVSVVPSLELEGFGLIALESLACGRPPIVTDCGGLPDAVTGLDRTLVVQPNDVQALASRIDSALQGGVPSASECRQHAESFNWAAVARMHIDLYSSLI